jgi:putative SOS response-associated peptidase YedK
MNLDIQTTYIQISHFVSSIVIYWNQKIISRQGNMCYYSSISVGFKIIETRFGVKFVQSESYQPVYSASAFIFPLMPVITNENPTQTVLMNWGLIPFWTKYNETAQRIKQLALNARSETIFEKPIFRQSILSKRCLVVVTGFFEYRGLSYPGDNC